MEYSSGITIFCRHGLLLGIEADISFPNFLDDGIVVWQPTTTKTTSPKNSTSFDTCVVGLAMYLIVGSIYADRRARLVASSVP